MRTLIIVGGGFALLGLGLLLGRWLGGPDGMTLAAKAFVPLWLALAGANLWLGTRAGYTVAEELPILLLIFALPAAAAGFALWKLGHA
jgi:hypothetical protein